MQETPQVRYTFDGIQQEFEKYNQVKSEIRGRQKQGMSEDEKKQLFQHIKDEAIKTVRIKLLEELHQARKTGTSR